MESTVYADRSKVMARFFALDDRQAANVAAFVFGYMKVRTDADTLWETLEERLNDEDRLRAGHPRKGLTTDEEPKENASQ